MFDNDNGNIILDVAMSFFIPRCCYCMVGGLWITNAVLRIKDDGSLLTSNSVFDRCSICCSWHCSSNFTLLESIDVDIIVVLLLSLGLSKRVCAIVCCYFRCRKHLLWDENNSIKKIAFMYNLHNLLLLNFYRDKTPSFFSLYWGRTLNNLLNTIDIFCYSF